MLGNNSPYFYSQLICFKNELDNVQTFVEKDYAIGMHMQEFFEINIITRGKGIHYIENNFVDARVGDVFIIPPMVRHGYTGGAGFDVCHILIKDEFIDKNKRDLQTIPSFFTLFTAEPLLRAQTQKALYLKLSAKQFEDIKELLHKLMNHHKKYTPSDALIRNAFAIVLITLLCKAYTENSQRDVDDNIYTHLLNAISYIHENYQKKVTIDELAEIAHLSRSSFVQKFKEICKMTPLEYITERRIEAAEKLLINTKLSFMDIAFRCGFYDAAHFTRSFFKHNGIRPSEYRKNHEVLQK